MRPSFFHHLHPPTIPAQQARFRYTLGAGGLSVFLVLVVLATGVLLMFYYIPSTTEAAQSIQTITFLVPFGAFVRNLHYWSAQGLLVAALVHLLRVIFTGAYHPPRRLNYLIGLVLLVVLILLNFSGYVLRWDEGIRWALVAGTNLLKTMPLIGDRTYRLVVGGDQLGQAALVRFYAWHIFGLTLVLVVLGVWHLFRLRRDGGIAVPPATIRPESQRISRQMLVRREALAALLVSAALVLVSGLVPAPLAAPLEDVLAVSADARAPWFFLWVQGLLQFGDAFWMGVFVPGLVIALLALIPYAFPLPKLSEMGRWWPRGNRLARWIAGGLLLLLLALTWRGLTPV